MGLILNKLFRRYPPNGYCPDLRMLVLGIDESGKTTFLYRMKLGKTVPTSPTIGFNLELVWPRKNVQFSMWDVGGDTKIRSLWHHYYKNIDGLFYVVDCSDRERLGESIDQFYAIFGEEAQLMGVPCVILANKQDLPNAIDGNELVAKLGGAQRLDALTTKWAVMSTCAITGKGLDDAMTRMIEFTRQQ